MSDALIAVIIIIVIAVVVVIVVPVVVPVVLGQKPENTGEIKFQELDEDKRQTEILATT